MKLIELLPLIECSTVSIYEKRKYRPSRFIVLINPKKIKGCISDDLLDREIYSISISYKSINYNREFNIYVCNKKDDEEFVKKAASIGLIEDVNNDDSDTEYGDKFEPKEVIEHDGCMGCVYEDFEELEEPCAICKGTYKYDTMAYLKAKDCYVRKVDKRKE